MALCVVAPLSLWLHSVILFSIQSLLVSILFLLHNSLVLISLSSLYVLLLAFALVSPCDFASSLLVALQGLVSPLVGLLQALLASLCRIALVVVSLVVKLLFLLSYYKVTRRIRYIIWTLLSYGNYQQHKQKTWICNIWFSNIIFMSKQYIENWC